MMDDLIGKLPPKAKAIRRLRALIEQSGLNPGESLPSERVLASELAVSRETIRSALRELTEQGLIATSGARIRRGVAASRTPAGGILTKTIALVSDNPLPQESFASIPQGFESYVYRSAATALQAADWNILSVRQATLGDGDMSALAAQRIGGMILFGSVAESPLGQTILKDARQSKAPIVVYGDNPNLANCDRCTSDHAAGAYELTRLLLARGKRRIQPFWRFSAHYHWLEQRELGYTRAMREAGLTPLPAIRTPDLGLVGQTTRDEFSHVVRMIAGYLIAPTSGPDPVDAFMVASDPHAFEVSAALKLAGRDPAQYPIVGYDNSYSATASRAWAPNGPVATADKDNAALGRELATLLLERIDGKLPESPQRRMIAARIVRIEEPA